MSDTLVIKGGRVVDPATGTNKIADVIIRDGIIAAVGKGAVPAGADVFDAAGAVVCPGLFDMHVHLREPGREDEETVASGCRAAAAGGFTAIACMPNTDPAIDNQETVAFIKRKAEGQPVAVYPVSAITKGRQGRELAEIGDAVAAGAVAVTDDGDWVADGNLMRRALEYAKMFDIPVISHCEDKSFVLGGCMNEGAVSTALGLRGIPALAEETAVARDIALAEYTGARLHLAHISTAGTVALVRDAKKRGVRVTAETAPHYCCLTDEEIRSFDTRFKMNPPLRTAADVRAVKKGLADGTIDCIATDHAPHSAEEKEVEFGAAPFGITGLETALPVCLEALVAPRVLSLTRLVEVMSYRPAAILGIPKPVIKKGQKADLTVFNPRTSWKAEAAGFRSLSANSPFIGKTLTGKVLRTFR